MISTTLYRLWKKSFKILLFFFYKFPPQEYILKRFSAPQNVPKNVYKHSIRLSFSMSHLCFWVYPSIPDTIYLSPAVSIYRVCYLSIYYDRETGFPSAVNTQAVKQTYLSILYLSICYISIYPLCVIHLPLYNKYYNKHRSSSYYLP